MCPRCNIYLTFLIHQQHRKMIYSRCASISIVYWNFFTFKYYIFSLSRAIAGICSNHKIKRGRKSIREPDTRKSWWCLMFIENFNSSVFFIFQCFYRISILALFFLCAKLFERCAKVRLWKQNNRREWKLLWNFI